ncbi:MAG: hypothetical protein FAF04_05125 [Epsilonproteobacteria bacterium]|nr:hypothetical protein [Campylobacterota bacterium]
MTVLSPFDSHKATKKYIEYSTNRYKISPEDIPEELFQLMQNHFENIALTFSQNQDNLLKLYKAALQELSVIDPILTYHLSGKESLSKIFNHSNQYEEKFLIYLYKNSQNKDFNNKLSANLSEEKNKLFLEQLKFMNQEIKALAWKCGIFDYFRCLSVLKKGISLDDLYNFEEINSFMDKLLLQIDNPK